MSGGLSKILPTVLYVLLGISALLGLLFYTGVVETELLMSWCYVLLGLATAVAVVFPILAMTKNPKAAKSALIGVGALAVVFIISYALAGDEMTPKYEKFISGPGESKLVSMGLIAFYILAIGAVIATVSSGFMKLFK
ncbi:MAG: hypothetical protein JKY48_13620 [Flavobacteriales bacterium]|nr:hypothetical protein [Flavobacteriales bacterium]